MPGTLRFLFPLALIPVVGLAAWQQDLGLHASSTAEPHHWTALTKSMHSMHAAMASVEQSGDCDMDFVRLMLPHHLGAIEMAKSELLYGKDPQMRRLAQEIITDQESEVQLMKLWMREHGPSSHDPGHAPRADKKEE